MTAYAVARRTREIGVRMALGAQPLQVVRLLVSEGARPVFAGTAIGLLLAAALSRFLRTLLYGVAPADPFSLAAAAVVLGTVAFLACLHPARHAARVDPMVALRCD